MMKLLHRARRWRKRFLRNEDGIAAVEFALVAPIMITLFLGAVEFSQAITVKRKIVALTSATADLVAQTKVMDSTVMSNVFEASTAILTPYDTGSLTIVVTGIRIDGSGDATVDWSKPFQGGTARAIGSSVTIPVNLQFPESGLIMTETEYDFSTVVGKFLTSGVHMSETFYLRPRSSTSVTWQ